ncbi:hypothetical protein TNCV_3880441 [Trichonephila clavipes]|nr:hypothetical protein TNCV_3880441 [Trichonephila clavipes]
MYKNALKEDLIRVVEDLDDGFQLLQRIFEPRAVETEEKRDRFEQTSRTLERKISMRSTKDQLIKKDALMPVKHNVLMWNLPDVEEVPSHDGETVAQQN